MPAGVGGRGDLVAEPMQPCGGGSGGPGAAVAVQDEDRRDARASLALPAGFGFAGGTKTGAFFTGVNAAAAA